MIAQLRTLFRYRLLIASLVSRELKARYRGSVLGFVWSFVNPLLLMLTYGLVFTHVFPGARPKSMDPYYLFLFCGILPWTWFQASLAEASGVLISGGNLIKKVAGLNIFQGGVFLFYISLSNVRDGTAPIVHEDAVLYTNPLPHVLILTAIVVAVATTSLALALIVRIRESYSSIEEDEMAKADLD